MKEQIIKIIESKAQGKYHLEIDESDLEIIANEILDLFSVSKRYFLFSGQENGKATKYLVDDCDDRETAIAKIETEYPNFKWVMTETFNAC